MSGNCILEVKHCSVSFPIQQGTLRAVSDVSLRLEEGRALCLLGESGCGKSVLGSAILQLLPSYARLEGEVYFRGQEIAHLPEKAYRKLRGKQISVIPQNAAGSLDPTQRIGRQIEEMYQLHSQLRRRERRERVVEQMRAFGLPRLPMLAREYPHMLSGGMKQRALVAAGTACTPALLIVDEPTKGLDRIRRKEVVDILRALQRQAHTAMLIITHDFELADVVADSVAIMYASEIVECGPREAVLQRSQHPYTRSLIAALPRNGFQAIEGYSPNLDDLPPGCAFEARCPHAREECARRHPALAKTSEGKEVRCFYAAD